MVSEKYGEFTQKHPLFHPRDDDDDLHQKRGEDVPTSL